MNAPTHQDRLRALADLLDALPDDLPEVLGWTSNTYRLRRGDGPSVDGYLDTVTTAVGDRLDATRAAMAAWGKALGVPATETPKGETLNFAVEGSVGGLPVAVRTYLYASGRCEGCGGPVIGGRVYRHYTDTPCGGAS